MGDFFIVSFIYRKHRWQNIIHLQPPSDNDKSIPLLSKADIKFYPLSTWTFLPCHSDVYRFLGHFEDRWRIILHNFSRLPMCRFHSQFLCLICSRLSIGRCYGLSICLFRAFFLWEIDLRIYFHCSKSNILSLRISHQQIIPYIHRHW